MLEEEEELNSERLQELENEHKPTCVILEYNSMWGVDKLDTLQLPASGTGPRWSPPPTAAPLTTT